MKAVILAAGKGSRLGPLTDTVPKPLLPYRGRPVLFRHIDGCVRDGVREVLINTHFLSNQIVDAVTEAYGDADLDFTFSYEPELLGTAGALNNFRDQIGSDDFSVIYGDNILEFDLEKLVAFHQQKEAAATIVGHHRDDVSMSGVIVHTDSGRITRFVEKPISGDDVSSNLVNAGVYILAPEVLEYVPEGVSDFGRDVFPRMLADGRILYTYITKEMVLPIDTPELYRSATDQDGQE